MIVYFVCRFCALVGGDTSRDLSNVKQTVTKILDNLSWQLIYHRFPLDIINLPRGEHAINPQGTGGFSKDARQWDARERERERIC
jgi:hypothetical protein